MDAAFFYPDDFFENIDQSEVEDLQRNIENYGVSGMLEFVTGKKREWQHVPLSVALVGEAAVGKSTFINSIRGLTADDEGAAPVGTGDVTQNPTMYPHPYNDQLVFWDLPGVGTPRFPRDKSYLGRVGYSKYDFFLLLSDDRFSSNDVWLAREIESMGKSYFFVRTKIDQAMESASYSDREFAISSVLNRIHDTCAENFKAAQLRNQTVYCISNYEREMWDFSKLMDDIIVSLPEQKRNAMVLSLSPLTKNVIRSKSAALRHRAYFIATLSGAQAAATSFVPIPLLGGTISVALDTTLLLEEVYFYLKQYGLDDESLTELSKKTGTTLDYYKEALKSGSTLVSSRQTAKQVLLKMIKSEAAEVMCKRASIEIARMIPVLGAIVGGSVSFGTSLYLLHAIIKDLEKDAIKVVEAVIEATSSQV